MSRMFVYSFACAVMGSSLALFSAQAFPISSLDSHLGPSDVTFVAGGCGIGFHRGPYGGCRPNRRPVVVVPGHPWSWHRPSSAGRDSAGTRGSGAASSFDRGPQRELRLPGDTKPNVLGGFNPRAFPG
jgi:hypothetical protein